MRDAYWRCISNIFDTNIDGCNRNDGTKRFWSFMKTWKKDSSGVSCLKDNGILKTGNKDNADIISKKDMSIDSSGVRKLLDHLNPHKTSGPDRLSARVLSLSARVLKECSAEIAQVLACIFNQSLTQGIVPGDWRQTNVAPIWVTGWQKGPYDKIWKYENDTYLKKSIHVEWSF